MTARSERPKEREVGFPRPARSADGLPLTESFGLIESRRVRVDDVELYCEIAGDGDPLLLIHGLGSCTLDWAPHYSSWRQGLAAELAHAAHP